MYSIMGRSHSVWSAWIEIKEIRKIKTEMLGRTLYGVRGLKYFDVFACCLISNVALCMECME